MTYASTSVDRRAQYYARCADIIAADLLDFYTRAERGRRWQSRFQTMIQPAQVVSQYLRKVARTTARPAAAQDSIARSSARTQPSLPA